MSVGVFPSSATGGITLSTQVSARHYAEQTASDLINDRPDVAHAIGELYVIHGTAEAVQSVIDTKQLGLQDGVAPKTVTNTILHVANAVLPEEMLTMVRRRTRRIIMNDKAEEIALKKRANGRMCFTPRETERLNELHDRAMRGEITYDEVVICMKTEFSCSMFTEQNCKKRVYNIRTKQKREKKMRGDANVSTQDMGLEVLTHA